MISVDVGRKVAIWTGEGQPEKQAPLVKGPRGFCTADFGWGPLDTETPNLLFDVGPVLKRPSKKTQKKQLQLERKRRNRSSPMHLQILRARSL